MKRIIIVSILISVFALWAKAQTNSAFSLKQCVEYALTNNLKLKNASIDVQLADQKKKQITAKALPQLDADVNYLHNFNVQRIILENGVIPTFSNPNLKYGEVIAFQLQLNNSLVGAVNASQVLYDGALFAGLKGSDIGKQLSQQQLVRSQTEVVEQVTKAYYGVLVSEQQLSFLTDNLSRLDSLFKEANAKYKFGLIRKIDLDRIEVSLNNLKQEREKSLRTVQLSKALLAYHMQYEGNLAFTLTEKLDETKLASILETNTTDYNNRIEYTLLKTQMRLLEMDKKSTKAEYQPRLYAFATSGYNPAASNATDLFQSSRYFKYSYVGVKLNMPLFHGNERKYKVGSKLLEERKMENTIKQTERMIDLEKQQAQTNYQRAMESVSIQKRNLDLAQENVKTIRVENEKGIATNLEVTNAETDLKEAQNNYYAVLYQALLAKVDLDKANGKLMQ